MSIGFCFWVIMIICAIFAVMGNWPRAGAAPGGTGLARFGSIGSLLIVFVLLFLLGWKVFGPPFHG